MGVLFMSLEWIVGILLFLFGAVIHAIENAPEGE